jgi:hypothetical protein
MLLCGGTGKSSNYINLKNKGAWFDTPLHFCAWLSKRRLEKLDKKIKRIISRRKIDAAVKRERWKTDLEFRRLVIEKRRLHRQLNKQKTRDWVSRYRKHRRKDPGIRLQYNARSRFWKVMAKVKAIHTTDNFNAFIGCSPAFLKQHIESQFEPWMNWDNYGPGWQMDHKIPLKFFDLFDLDQAKSAFHFSNLKPVSAAYNASKQARWSDV